MADNIKFSLDYAHLPFGNSGAILDPRAIDLIDQPLHLTSILNDVAVHKKYCDTYLDWIKSYNLHSVSGLEKFPYACFSSGTTESFDRFYTRHRNRRFRCFKGEYLYHRLVWRNDYPDWCYLDDSDLDANDAVIMSFPFADTGGKHKHYDQILDICDQLGIPVLVDCAYFTISQGLDFNFNHECITDITFSLSKTLPIAHARVGLRLTKQDTDDGLFVYNKNGYIHRVACAIGLKLMENIESVYITNTYKDKQKEFCDQIGVEVSNTVLLGIGGAEWQQYNRGSETNRLSFHKFLHLGILCLEQK
jgi:hypothetical protein